MLHLLSLILHYIDIWQYAKPDVKEILSKWASFKKEKG